ncbi:MAG: quinone-dependent dihydroorotate dehydrogenase [Bacteroidota bacterium]
MYQSLLKPLLFQLPAETAHRLSFSTLKTAHQTGTLNLVTPALPEVSLEKELMGLRFKNPVGLAAGFDKNAELIDVWEHFGFGFIEVGTVTPKPQAGNPKPRLFRLPQDKALINRMGFNNEGLAAMKTRLKVRKTNLVIGGNIGKNKVTPNESAFDDYRQGFEELVDVVDYLAVNVSSPNTPGLRDLQDKEPLLRLLAGLQELNQQRSEPKPLLLKIAPDLTEGQLDDILDIYRSVNLSGLIATNTTISRDDLQASPQKLALIGAGGLSGMPVRERATEVVRYLREGLPEGAVIIGVGGVTDAKSAQEKLDAGADLVQLYTGFVYGGPSTVKGILSGLR